LRSQLGHARQQLAARRTVERAKGVLMAEAGLDEEQAHSRLRKLAMDRGKRLVDVAESIIEARDLLRPGGG
jgi:response regulator NasT